MKKIIVSHSKKQHSYHVANTFANSNTLVAFFTSIGFSKEKNFLKKLFPDRLSKKREVPEKVFPLLKLTFLPELVSVFGEKIKNHFGHFWADRIHDLIVASRLFFQKYDVIIGYERQSLWSFKVSKLLGKRTVLDVASVHYKIQQNINSTFPGIITGADNDEILFAEEKLKQKEIELADEIIVLSEFAKKTFIEAGVDERKLKVLHLGVDVKLFNPFQSGKKKKKNQLLIVSSMRRSKGIIDLIQSISTIESDDISIKLVGGNGDAISFVKNCQDQRVEYIPFLPHEQLKDMYLESSVFVLPSYFDSWGQVVVEAMASGLPVITTTNVGAAELIEDGESGYIIKPGCPKQLEETIRLFLSNSEMCLEMGEKARERAKNLSWEAYYQKLSHLIQES